MVSRAYCLGATCFVVLLAGCSSTPHATRHAPPSPADVARFDADALKKLPEQRGEEPVLPSVALTTQDPQSDWPAPVHDAQRFTFLRAEQLEYRLRDGAPDVARWEAQGWHGTDYHKLWVKSEGEVSLEGPSEGDVEVQALYSQLVAPFWDFQVGTRYDQRWGPGPNLDRWFGVVGVQGFAPYEFETELALFVSEDADVSARLTASTDFLFTQRLILQPRFETEVAIQEVPDFQVGQGLNYIDLGLRLRYEFKREFAPYVGVNWIRSLGETEDLVRSDGGQASDFAFVFGLSVWF